MKLTCFIATLPALTSALPNYQDWHPAGPNDARSPCPALNSLANHGILPRSGRNLTMTTLVTAITSGLNVSPEMATSLAQNGLSLSKDPSTGAMDLDDLNLHNAIEHDASLSRQDAAMGDSTPFSPEIFAQTLSYFPQGASAVSIADVAAARWGRVQYSRANNPEFKYADAQIFPSHFESSAYFQLLMDKSSQTARVDWIKAFFAEERLPWNEGWRGENKIDGFSTAQVVMKIAMNTREGADGLPCGC